MAGLLESILGIRGYPEGYAEKVRNRILQPVKDEIERRTEEKRVQDLAGALKGSTGRGGALGQFGAETAGQLGPLLASKDPQTVALGTSLLGQLMGAKAAPKGTPFDERMMTPAQRVQAKDQRSQFDQTYSRQGEQWQAEQGLRLSADQRDQQRTQAFLAAQAAAAEASRATGAQAAQYGGLKPEQFLAEADATRAVAQGVGASRMMVKILGEFGNLGKLANPDARARLETLQFTLIPALQKSLNAGGQNALGTEEREFLRDFMGNPQAFLMRPSVTMAKLEGIADKLESDLDYRSKTRPFLPVDSFTIPSYELPPGLVPLSGLQRRGFLEQVGSGDVNPGWGIPR